MWYGHKTGKGCLEIILSDAVAFIDGREDGLVNAVNIESVEIRSEEEIRKPFLGDVDIVRW